MATKKVTETTPALEVENIETPEVKTEEHKDTTPAKTAKKFKFNKDDICIGSVLISLGLIVLCRLFRMIGIAAPALYIVFFCIGCALTGLSMFFVFTQFRRENKFTFTVQFVLNIISLVFWLLF